MQPYLSLLVAPALAALALSACTSTADTQFSGTLTDASERRAEDNSPVDLHTLKLKRGKEISITMRAEGFTPYLQVQGPDGTETAANRPCVEGDPASGSCAQFTTREAGEYIIYANSLDESGRGSYEIFVEEIAAQ